MTGAVFHPGHDEWHGQTVVVYTHGSKTVIGRWDSISSGQVIMRDAAVHVEGQDEDDLKTWVSKIQTYGIPVEHPSLSFPEDDVTSIARLRDA